MIKSIKTLLSRYFYILNEKPYVVALLVGAFLASGLLDAVGIGAFGILVHLLMNPEAGVVDAAAGADLSLTERAQLFLGLEQRHELIIVVGIGVCAAFVFKGVSALTTQLLVVRFNARKIRGLQLRFFRAFMRAPLIFRLNRNFAHMAFTVNYLCTNFVGKFNGDLIKLIGNLILAAIYTAILASTNLTATVALVGLFGALALLYYLFVRNRITYHSRAIATDSRARGKIIREALSSFNETRILGCEKYFEKRVDRLARNVVFHQLRAKGYRIAPRILAELLLIVSIVAFSIFYYITYGNLADISAQLGIFGLAGLRLVPIISTLISSANGVKGTTYIVHDLYDEMREIETVEARETKSMENLSGEPGRDEAPRGGKFQKHAFPFDRQIELKNVTFRYPGSGEDVLKSVNLRIQRGSAIALVGKSGSGKSTLINTLVGQLVPSSGEVLVDGKSVFTDIRAWQDHISYLPQSIYILDDTVARNVAFGLKDKEIDQDRVEWAVQEAQLSEFVNSLPKGLDTHLGDEGGRISGGQRQRIGIARALYYNRDVLVMDEATSALDEVTEEQVKEAIYALKGKLTVIMITHHLKGESRLDAIYRMEEGQIVAREETAQAFPAAAERL